MQVSAFAYNYSKCLSTIFTVTIFTSENTYLHFLWLLTALTPLTVIDVRCRLGWEEDRVVIVSWAVLRWRIVQP